jgi:hypothetical protein
MARQISIESRFGDIAQPMDAIANTTMVEIRKRL